MQTWFSCKVKYQKIDEHGKMIRASETYLVEAINFTEAETRIFEMMEQYGNGDIMVAGISKTNFSEILNYEDGQYWYKAKVTWEDFVEESSKVSKITNYLLVAANSVKQTYERVEESMESMMVPIEIPAVSLSPILDVFPLFEEGDEEVQISSNLTPISEFDEEKEEAVITEDKPLEDKPLEDKPLEDQQDEDETKELNEED